jgi:hypothetical protein
MGLLGAQPLLGGSMRKMCMALNYTLICCRVGFELHLFGLPDSTAVRVASYAGLMVDGRIEGLGTMLPAQPFLYIMHCSNLGEH